ncbi:MULTISPECIES: hypothetical protein [Streptomyces]|uniref:Secreted protein n=1 Tax=Streptomyces eurythermus TaxID=42237 RepID=A0ABW6Z7E1_9ACTN|nr:MULTISPECIES: hypothetical protein [Streptomyces]QIS74881.1 hypothetical protein HB370_36885 [Streptomyces sp. DSM 40868]
MNTGLRITAYAAALAAAFGIAYGVGGGVGEISLRTESAAHDGHAGATPGGKPAAGPGPAAAPGGLQTSERGYTLDLRTPAVTAGRKTDLRFAVVRDATGRPLTAYREEHTKELHLIIASRDLTHYQHLHPTRATDGTWSAPLTLPRAGVYRVFADFTPDGGEGLTLGADLTASGAYAPAPLPAPAATAEVDGYQVSLRGRLSPGRDSALTLGVTRDGKPVRDLQPYLGAYGHLVALRSGDLGYLHVHPNGEPGDGRTRPGPDISFTTTAPSTGTYRLFLDFKHAGRVHTAAFTVRAGRPAERPDTPASPAPESGEHSGHRH